jgi:hypothetical protein
VRQDLPDVLTRRRSNTMYKSWLGATMVFATLMAAVLGCGKGDTGGRLGIAGSVTFQGKPLDKGTIEFSSTGEIAAMTGAMIKNGSYEIPAEKGLPPGKFLVRISSVAEDPSAPVPEMPGMPEDGVGEAKELIPAEYNTESKQEVTVTSDGPNQFDFDIR